MPHPWRLSSTFFTIVPYHRDNYALLGLETSPVLRSTQDEQRITAICVRSVAGVNMNGRRKSDGNTGCDGHVCSTRALSCCVYEEERMESLGAMRRLEVEGVKTSVLSCFPLLRAKGP